MIFNEAAALFLQSRASLTSRGRGVRFVSPRTHKDLAVFIKTLGKFFGEIPLNEIHPGNIVVYQNDRANGVGFVRTLGKGPRERTFATYAGAAKINDEVGVLRRVMIAGGCWTPELEELYVPLMEPDLDLPKALSYHEQEHFLATAAAIPDCEVVWWYSLVALHATFSSDEMRTIRQGDINLSHGILAVNRNFGKNTARRREIALTDGACMWALERLIERSIKLGGRGPQLHLFPKRSVRNRYDGNIPMCETGLRKPFHEARIGAGLPWFCINGWRHTAITRLAEQGVPIAVIQRRAGHMSPKMTAHYTHISEQFERAEMIKAGQRKPVGSADAPWHKIRAVG